MNFDICRPWQQEREDARPVLTIPVHDEVDHQHKQDKVQPVLARAAKLIASSGKVWRWDRYDGAAKLVRWSEDKHFVNFSIDEFRELLGRWWRVLDTNGSEWAGPSRAVADRIMAAS